MEEMINELEEMKFFTYTHRHAHNKRQLKLFKGKEFEVYRLTSVREDKKKSYKS